MIIRDQDIPPPELMAALGKLPWLAQSSIVFANIEGFRAPNVFGWRIGPDETAEAALHEVAHAIELAPQQELHRLNKNSYGLCIKSKLIIGGLSYEEPRTGQASAREARVIGIQSRLLQAIGYNNEQINAFQKDMVKILHTWMPDTIFISKEATLSIIQQSYAEWTLSRIESTWPQVEQALLKAEQSAALSKKRQTSKSRLTT